MNVKYTIVGNGTKDEIEKITNAISFYNLEDSVKYVGEKRGQELQELLKIYNVGVSYIPLTSYYDCQPPTKTYEYLLSSMAVIATPTKENKKVISAENGEVSYDDSAESFSQSIYNLYTRRAEINLEKIYVRAKLYSWSNIADKYLLPLCQ